MGLKQFWVEKLLGLKKFGVEKNFGLAKNLGLKKFCPRTFWSTKIVGPKSLVKIGPVTTEILLIWTNVARAYVAWKNVTMTVDIF